MPLRIRDETAADHAAVRQVHRLAFGQEEEARLVDVLRAGGFARVSLVAENDGQVVGHVLFSDLPIITPKGTVAALALAPLAVLPACQRQGIGSALVRQGLGLCRERGHRIVVVVGHPEFYPRFGFSSDLARQLQSPFSGKPSFMAAELASGALHGVRGRVVYPPPFAGVLEIRPVRPGDQADWLRMRALLWPDCPAAQHAQEIAAFFGTASFGWSAPFLAEAAFVAVRIAGGLCGFLEASLRPWVEDCATRPVGYVEGWFVDADVRRQGIGSRLLAAAQEWATAQGCREMASDAHIENLVSLKAHKALGFEESSRAVHLRKPLPGASAPTTERSCPTRQRTLLAVDGTFAVCRLAATAPVPAWATSGDFFSISRTAEELSVVCRQDAVPEGVRSERGWRCLRVAGTIPFAAVGVLAALTAPLAEAGVSVFAVSTFDTDYLLVREPNWNRAVAALRQHGHEVRSEQA
jgi:putative acetyltransferase